MFPWFKPSQEKLSKAYQASRLSHGILVTADKGYAKFDFALDWIGGFLCEVTQREKVWHSACGQCKSCLLMKASTHPDFYLIDYLVDTKGKPKASIGIDQIRHLTEKLTETSQLNGWKVGLIRSVTDMTKGAFNALLKTLEEPADNTLLFLLSDHLQRVPATIKSRCQIVQPEFTTQDLNQWLAGQTEQSSPNIQQALKSCFNAPLAAKDYLETDYQLTEENFFQLCDQLLLNQAYPDDVLAHQELNWQQQFKLLTSYFYQVQLACLSSSGLSEYQSLPTKLPFQLYSALIEFNRAQLAGSNLQPQIQFQEILIKWFEAGRKIAYLSKS